MLQVKIAEGWITQASDVAKEANHWLRQHPDINDPENVRIVAGRDRMAIVVVYREQPRDEEQ